MFKQLSKILLGTSTISCLSSIILLLLIYRPNPKTHDGGQGIIVLIIGCLFATFILLLSSMTVFLNLSESIRSDRLIRPISFLMFPTIVLLYFILTQNSELFFIINAATFLTTLIFFYMRFTKTINQVSKLRKDNLTET
jgi:hypothetical protein